LSGPIHDSSLLQAFQHGDAGAERTVFDHFFEPLCDFSERITRDSHQAQDIVTESFMKVLSRRTDFETLRQISKFLYTMVRNASINYAVTTRRRRQIHEEIRYLNQPQAQTGEELELERQKTQQIRSILREIPNLPDRRGQVFQLLFVEQMTNEDIAARLDIDCQSVRTHKARAINSIRRALEQK
jgi:RNA polymerase sigma factor (sigma-70 family)